MNNYFKILLSSCVLVGLVAAPADAKKEFAKSEAKKTPLGENTVTLPSGLQYKDVKVGTGTAAQWGNVVWIDYTAWVMPDLREFDSTKQKGRPLNIVLGGKQLCQGVDDGLMNMKVNGKRLLLVPPDLGFPKGSSTSRIIPPRSQLKYEITLVHVGPKMPKKPVAPTNTKPTGKPS